MRLTKSEIEEFTAKMVECHGFDYNSTVRIWDLDKLNFIWQFDFRLDPILNNAPADLKKQ